MPPFDQPTMLPPGAAPAGPPLGPPGGPPGGYGPPPGYGGPGGPPYPTPPGRPRWRLFVALGLTLAVLAGLGVFGFLYSTGRLGFGPLSGADKEAVAAIAAEVSVPEWVDAEQVECAADKLLHETRSKDLEDNGLIERDGGTTTYTQKWENADAHRFYAGLLDCSEDWSAQLGKAWKIGDTACLEDVGRTKVGAWFAADQLELDDAEAAEDDRAEAVEELDDCYAQDPEPPTATATPAYRAVAFALTAGDADAGESDIEVDRDGAWTPVSTPTVKVDTAEGGREGCLTARTVVDYPWGTTRTAEDEFCGNAKPRRIFWKRAPRCTVSPNCTAWVLHYAGFKSFAFISANFTSNGGNCLSVSGTCTNSIVDRGGKGKGKIVTWSFPASYRGNFVATVDGLTAKIPN